MELAEANGPGPHPRGQSSASFSVKAENDNVGGKQFNSTNGTGLNRSQDISSQRKVNFSITQAQFNAMQDQVRSKLGMTMPFIGAHGNPHGAPQAQDRLITSISIIKEVLISNMQLREDLLSVSQEHENTMGTNFQLMIENEDLRDRLGLLTDQVQDDPNRPPQTIDYLPYFDQKRLEHALERTESFEELSRVKGMILSHVFSLRKENRHLLRRIQNFEEKYNERKRRKNTKGTHSRQNSNVDERLFDTENSIDLYPEMGPQVPTIEAKAKS